MPFAVSGFCRSLKYHKNKEIPCKSVHLKDKHTGCYFHNNTGELPFAICFILQKNRFFALLKQQRIQWEL